MKAVVQRVARSQVIVAGEIVGAIDAGLMVLLGIARNDTPTHVNWMAEKLIHLRIFEDAAGRMNHSLLEVGGEMLVVSQFTLLGDCRKGRRPSFGAAAPPEMANQRYKEFVAQVARNGISVQTGRFGAAMSVSLTNDGPVTLLVETPDTL
ncbi:MAG: D-aminoacyl-tRNA deacylase [Desulfosarcinaceae bacterium]|nr:D-aminoacyl-tRNA deacylase [Desulfosarcinaceae bacterium]